MLFCVIADSVSDFKELFIYAISKARLNLCKVIEIYYLSGIIIA